MLRDLYHIKAVSKTNPSHKLTFFTTKKVYEQAKYATRFYNLICTFINVYDVPPTIQLNGEKHKVKLTKVEEIELVLGFKFIYY